MKNKFPNHEVSISLSNFRQGLQNKFNVQMYNNFKHPVLTTANINLWTNMTLLITNNISSPIITNFKFNL